MTHKPLLIPTCTCITFYPEVFVVFITTNSPLWHLIPHSFHFHFFHFISLEKENTMIILHNPQIAELIEAGCTNKSNIIISKSETKEIEKISHTFTPYKIIKIYQVLLLYIFRQSFVVSSFSFGIFHDCNCGCRLIADHNKLCRVYVKCHALVSRCIQIVYRDQRIQRTEISLTPKTWTSRMTCSQVKPFSE